MSRIAALYWLGVTVMLTLTVHVVAVLIVPRLEVENPWTQRLANLPITDAVVLPDPAPGAQSYELMDPFFIYAMCRFDVSEGPLTVSVPEPDTYWSLAFYDDDRTNFYAINDRSAGNSASGVFVMLPEQVPGFWALLPAGAAPPLVIEATQGGGVAILRILVDHPTKRETYRGFANEFSCAPSSF